MKKLLVIAALIAFSFGHSQAYSGKGDGKFQVGANFQDNGTGLNVSYDYGIGENISVGVSSTYVLGLSDKLTDEANFGDRYDLRVRFNANIGNVLAIDDNFDLYPGLSLGLKNFGGHLGARYFFTSGFGLYTEFNVPFAKYDTSLTAEQKLHNQFTLNFGAVFNL
ncbi:hypothetical protein HNV10_02140 [Winogradskyella litoriviva]|uniref:Outer membrane protein beta-barrel domain-containing protein n=1 Tax=Winogradskyella litoriviva TaxID=1220182 RepID=A0ABX2E0L0_9FLAO|nr:DUF6646 family protein [Winogradskyella litoriviva]NRD22023.1 hypothetical protein [Winogradskyella litoriviva]